MRQRSEINTPEIAERIKAASDRFLGAHVALSTVFEHSRLWITCLVCEGRWVVVNAEGSRSGLDLRLVTDGDGYCEEGATDYFDSEGNVMKRM